MKKITALALVFLSVFSVYGQLIIQSGSNIVINNGSMVVVSDINNLGGTIKNDGDLLLKGDVVNNTSGLLASNSTGTVTFSGSSAQEITGNTDANFYGTLEIDNSSGVSLTAASTGSDQTVNGQLVFTNGVLVLNAFDLTIGATDPTGMDASKYIKTNSTGSLKRSVTADGSTNVLYPGGNSA
jgi:hypothetical protein